MLYHEFGYYEYDLAPFKNWLKNKEYSNATFAPKNVKIVFDESYLKELNMFINSNKANNIIFIYGENDPWALVQPDLSANKKSKKFIVKNGCHKSRVSDLDDKQKEEVVRELEIQLEIK